MPDCGRLAGRLDHSRERPSRRSPRHRACAVQRHRRRGAPQSGKGGRVGIPVWEDIWGADVVECIAETGGEILLVPNGSPYWRDKTATRLNIAVARVVESGLPLVYLNLVGGQDELVFDGASFGLNADSSYAFQLPAFRETVVTTQWQRENGTWRCLPSENAMIEEGDEADYAPCVLGLRDYADKNGFKAVAL